MRAVDAAIRESTAPADRRLLVLNTAALVLAYAIPRALTFVAAVVAARVLGAAVFGGFTTAAALAVLASIFGSLGLQPLLVREIARGPADAPALLAAADSVRAAAVVLMAAALLLGVLLLHLPAPVALGAGLLGAGYAVGGFVENRGAYFQGIERMHVWTRASALVGLVSGVLGTLLALATGSLVAFCAAPLAGQGAALLWLRGRAPRAGSSRARRRALVRSLAPFAAAFVATTLYYRSDVLLLARWWPAREVGLYGAAHRFLDVAQALALAAAGALLPRMARSPGAGAAIARRALLLGSAAAAAALLALRVPVVRLLYGSDYAAAAPVLALLAPAIVPLSINMLALAALAAADRMGAAARSFLIATVLLLALDLWLVPRHGATGAAAAELVAESALALLLARDVARAARP